MRRSALPACAWGAAAAVAATAGCAFDPLEPVSGGAPPVVQQITAEPHVIEAGTTALVTAGVTDPEGGRLIFEWTARDGTLLNAAGPGVEWMAPTVPGAYEIKVRATDPAGLFDEGQLFVAVVEGETNEPGNNEPSVYSLTATPDALLLGESAHLVVVASDADGDPLTYEWLMGIGDGDADGTETDWTPNPDLCCTQNYAVGVLVRDGHGGRATSTVSIHVQVN
ncbi:MAG TPA: PKD domain-containing protein [Myxococcota bacterium]|jgi:hypothetical protein|nr:PKD domain-containing protein [Myxococcota bacterium]